MNSIALTSFFLCDDATDLKRLEIEIGYGGGTLGAEETEPFLFSRLTGVLEFRKLKERGANVRISTPDKKHYSCKLGISYVILIEDTNGFTVPINNLSIFQVCSISSHMCPSCLRQPNSSANF